MSWRIGPAALALAAIAVPAQPGPRQDTRPPHTLAFGSEVQVVRLNVSVLDRDDRFVTDLKEKDFEVLEDGVPQVLTTFVRHELPVSLVLLMDASDSIASRLALAKSAAIGFLEALRPEDEASLVTFNDSVVVHQGFTSDREALRAAVGRISAGGPTALYNALYVTLKSFPPPREDADLRRRAILLLSDGADTASLVWEEQVIELARRREATIHVIDLRQKGEPTNRSAQLLRLLADESGGEVHQPGSIHELDNVYARIAQELRSQYTMGYVSSDPGHDGRWRRIEVRVPARPDLRLRHRTGYYDAS